MSRWRPAHACTYVIADLHGKFAALQAILNRILPLREQDRLIFLGDYIDRGDQSPEIIDKLIELKNNFGNRVIFLMGNHEWMLLSLLGELDIYVDIANVDGVWLHNGGRETIQSYERYLTNKNINPRIRGRYIPNIPPSHIEFLSKLKLYYEDSDYIFVHAGCDPNMNLDEQSANLLLWDRSLFNFCKESFEKERGFSLNWEKTVVCGHNCIGPFIREKYIMLDCTSYEKVCCLELNSMECFTTENKEKRMLRYIY